LCVLYITTSVHDGRRKMPIRNLGKGIILKRYRLDFKRQEVHIKSKFKVPQNGFFCVSSTLNSMAVLPRHPIAIAVTIGSGEDGG